MLVPVFAVALLTTTNSSPGVDAATDPFRCAGSNLYFPASGVVGWTYGDPASTDTDARGNRTIHTGVDIFGDGGDGAPVYAPADGRVSRQHGSENVNIVLPGVTNILTGEEGIELYITHFWPTLAVGQTFKAGEIIGVQEGGHIHFSVGAFIGYDDRELWQTQDPSPYFHAALTYNPYALERHDVSHWCHRWQTVGETAVAPALRIADQTHIVQSGDTLYDIAEIYGVKVDEIAAANALSDADYLSIGQKIVIPGVGQSSVALPVASAGNQSTAGFSPHGYVVEAGDSLYAIALRFGTEVEEIVRLNDLADPDVLAVGDYLLIA
jgi:LysM repeat protein